MFIVWSGFGFIAVILALGFGALGDAVLHPAIDHLRPGRELIDPKTNQRVVLRRNHSLFWIPIQYVSALMLIAAVVVVVSPSTEKHATAAQTRGDT